MIDEVENAIVGPVQILEHEHQRPLLSKGLEKATPRRERLRPALLRRSTRAAESDERPKLARDALRLGRIGRGYRGGELLLGDRGGIAVEDLDLRLDDLGERPERDRLAVGKSAAAAPRDKVTVRLDRAAKLVDEPTFPDPWHPDDGDELGGALALDARKRVREHVELLRASNELSSMAALDANTRARLDCDPHRDRLRLPFRADRLRVSVDDHVPGCAVGLLADEDPVHRSRRLQARCGIDDVAGGHPFSRLRPCAEGDEGLARVHGESQVQIRLACSPVPDRQRRPYRPFGVVLVRHRRAKECDDRVADELLHGSPETLQLCPYARVIVGEQRAHVLGIHPLGLRGRSDQIAEQRGDDLPFVPGRAYVCLQRTAAPTAEAETVRVLLSAARTRQHTSSVR